MSVKGGRGGSQWNQQTTSQQNQGNNPCQNKGQGYDQTCTSGQGSDCGGEWSQSSQCSQVSVNDSCQLKGQVSGLLESRSSTKGGGQCGHSSQISQSGAYDSFQNKGKGFTNSAASEFQSHDQQCIVMTLDPVSNTNYVTRNLQSCGYQRIVLSSDPAPNTTSMSAFQSCDHQRGTLEEIIDLSDDRASLSPVQQLPTPQPRSNQ